MISLLLPSSSSVEIANRRHLNAWRRRANHKIRFLFISFTVGFFIIGGLFAGLQIQYALGQNKASSTLDIVLHALRVGASLGALLGGPVFVIASGWMLIKGVDEYRRVLGRLGASRRVCNVCSAVAMYDDKYIAANSRKGLTAADLVPHMNVVKEDGKAHVLCDACLSEVQAIDGS